MTKDMVNVLSNVLNNVEPQIFSVAVINLDNVAANYRQVQECLSSETDIGAVVKANSYGFGAIPVSKKLYAEGCRTFFVATIDEGVEVRSVLQDDAEIYVLSGAVKGCESLMVNHKLIPVMNDPYQIDLWSAHGQKCGCKLKAVVQVDTGMCRNGLSLADVEKYHQKLKSDFDLKFVLSHLACADTPDHEKNVSQLNRFRHILEIFGDGTKGSFSATNGIFLGKEYHFDVVRPGKCLYGFAIRKDKVGTFTPVMDVFARIIQVQDIAPGETIGYGATFVADKQMKAVTVGMGYADGFMRKFTNFGHAFLGGRKIPMVGRISMDYMVFDASEIDDSYINIGDWVSMTQSPDDTLEKWALEMDTLPHEVACRFGRRVKRIYVGDCD
jgi:alanine racemase